MKIERIQIQAFGRLQDFDSGGDPLGSLLAGPLLDESLFGDAADECRGAGIVGP